MEGILYLKDGILNGWNKYYAILKEEESLMVLLKKSYTGKVKLSLSLSQDIQGLVHLKVYPMNGSETDMLCIYADKNKYRLRCESPFKRI